MDKQIKEVLEQIVNTAIEHADTSGKDFEDWYYVYAIAGDLLREMEKNK